MVNKFQGPCAYCRATVPSNGGYLLPRKGRGWQPVHVACYEARGPQVIEIEFSTGARMTQNAKGRCIDAPCCGCCT